MSDIRPVPVRRNVGGQPLGLAQELRDLVAHRFLLHQLVWRDLTVRYRRSYLGFLWTMMHPLLMMLIFVVVFSRAFRFPIPHYETYFLSEYIAWMFFSQTTVNAMVSVAWNGPLMKRVFVPKTIFPISSTLAGLVNFSLSLLVLVVIMVIVGAPIHATILFLPVSLAILGIFTLGASLALCALAVYFVDVREMFQAALPAVFYLTPVVYPIDIVPEIFRPVIKLNPLIYLLEIVRDPIYYGILPSPLTLTISIVLSLGMLTIGWIVYRHLAPRFHSKF